MAISDSSLSDTATTAPEQPLTQPDPCEQWRQQWDGRQRTVKRIPGRSDSGEVTICDGAWDRSRCASFDVDWVTWMPSYSRDRQDARQKEQI